MPAEVIKSVNSSIKGRKSWVRLTRVPLPVKVLLRVAVALAVQTVLLSGRAVGERNMVVGNVVEEVNLLLLQHQTGGDRVDRSITPTLVKETAILIKRLKVVDVGLGTEPVEATNLKVGPLQKLLG